MSNPRVRHWFFGISPFRRALLLVVVLLAASFAFKAAFTSGREYLARWRFSREEVRLLKEIEQSQQRAALAEGKATQINALLIQKDRELAEVRGRLEMAETALQAARNVTVRFRNDYEKSRAVNLADIPADAAKLCAELYTLGYSCRPRL